MADARERHVRRRDPIAVHCCVGKRAFALSDCGFVVRIVRDRDVGMRELECRDVHEVAPDDHALAFAAHDVRRVTRRVTDRADFAYAGGECVTRTGERFKVARRNVRCHALTRAGERGLGVFGGFGRDRFAQPEVRFAFVRANDRIREDRDAVGRGQSTDMIGMEMCDVDFIDLLGLVAGRREIVGEFSERGTEEIAAAGIDQHEFRTRVHKIRIDRRRDGIFDEHFAERRVDARRGRISGFAGRPRFSAGVSTFASCFRQFARCEL